MVVDGHALAASQVVSLAISHLRLWVVRASHRVDLAPSTRGAIVSRRIPACMSVFIPPTSLYL
jgi:hypothetical protein